MVNLEKTFPQWGLSANSIQKLITAEVDLVVLQRELQLLAQRFGGIVKDLHELRLVQELPV